MKNLQSEILAYLNNYDKKIMITDYQKSYFKTDILKKIFDYKKKLEFFWKNSPNKGVAILMDRDVDYICLIFASWLAKGYYLPLSLDSPKININYQLNNSGVNLLVKKEKSKIKFLKLKKNITSNIIKKNFKKVAYVIFTSGSTGKKKGVCISRKNLFHYMKSIKKYFQGKYKPKSLVINGELTFDISLADIVFAIVFGSEIIITNKSKNLLSLFSLINSRKAESIYVVPSTLNKIIEFSKKIGISHFKSVRQINSGGEELKPQTVTQIKKIFKNIKFFNFYGPTEFTINSTCFELNLAKKYKEIPMGKPLPGVKCLIVDKKNIESSKGELLLSGQQRMLGYVNYKEPFKKINNQFYYPTGDIVKKDKKNNIIFVGRLKDYIKFQGYRINLTKIENIISRSTSFPAKVCLAKDKLVLFLEIMNLNKRKINAKVKNIFKKKLENYETPSLVILKKKFPYLSSGKVDSNRMINLLKN